MKRIAIIGGGISGLTVLHYLKQRLGDSVDMTLFEREAVTGGTIRSFKKDSCLFEWGPNGFLNNQPATLQLIQELGLADQLIEAKATANQRYLQINGQLNLVPSGPLDLIGTPLLSLKDKWSLIAGLFKKHISKNLSIYDYVSQRFTTNIAETLIDPFMGGIYAGDIKHLHMASAFPKFKGKGPQKARMRSFKGGMGQIIEALGNRYKKHIKVDSEISSANQIQADITIVATAAYGASKIVESLNPKLADLLNQINYAPIVVAGLLFEYNSFKTKPEGFGYLVASKEKKDVLGVLIESNVYDERAGNHQIMLRVMMGGAHHPAIINDSNEQFLTKAIKEIDGIYGLISNPIEGFVKLWPKAIPQYEMNYPHLRQSMAEACTKTPGLYLCANYLDGVSFNDCINNAKSFAMAVRI